MNFRHTWGAQQGAEARVASVRPAGAEQFLGEYEHGILSVAPSDPICRGPELARTRSWMGPRLRQGVVLLADGLEVAFFQIRDGWNASRAEIAVEEAGRRFLEEEAPLFTGPGCRFQFARTSSLLELEACGPFRKAALKQVYGEARPGEGIARLAEAWADSHVQPGMGGLSQGLLRQLALDAMVDHLAVLGLLRSQGWGLHVHQGLSWVLSWMNGDRAMDLPAGMQRMIFVELGPRIWP